MPNHIEDKLDKIESKLDKMDSRIDSIDITSAKQSVILEEHTKRSLANEKAVEILAKKLTPIEKHVIIVNFCVKCALVLIGSGLLSTIIKWAITHYYP